MPPKRQSARLQNVPVIPTLTRKNATVFPVAPKTRAQAQQQPPAPPAPVPQAPKLTKHRVATSSTPWTPSSDVPPTWEQYSRLSEKQKEKVKLGWVPDPPPATLKRATKQIPQQPFTLPVNCCRQGTSYVNDFQGGGIPLDRFLTKENIERAKNRTFVYAVESMSDRLGTNSRGGGEAVVKNGRSKGLGRLYEYISRYGNVGDHATSGVFLLGLQDVGPVKGDDLQGESRYHAVERQLHRLAKTKIPDSKRRARGWEQHVFSSIQDAEETFNDPSLKRIKVDNAPARRSERAKTTRDCVQYGIFKEGEGLLRYEAAPGMENLLNPRPARWF